MRVIKWYWNIKDTHVGWITKHNIIVKKQNKILKYIKIQLIHVEVVEIKID